MIPKQPLVICNCCLLGNEKPPKKIKVKTELHQVKFSCFPQPTVVDIKASPTACCCLTDKGEVCVDLACNFNDSVSCGTGVMGLLYLIVFKPKGVINPIFLAFIMVA